MMRPAIHCGAAGSPGRGFSLVETLVSMAILVTVIAGTMSIYAMTNSQTTRTRVVGEAQESARLGLDMLGNDIRLAGSGASIGNIGISPGGGDAVRIPVIYSGPNVTITEPGGQSLITNSVFIIMADPNSISIPVYSPVAGNANTFESLGEIGTVVPPVTQGIPLTIRCMDVTESRTVDCANPSINVPTASVLIPATLPPLLVGDRYNALYITPTALSAPAGSSPQTQQLTYAEELCTIGTGCGFSTNPDAPFGIPYSSRIMRARVVHWYLKQTAAGQPPRLVRSYPTLTSLALTLPLSPTAIPFLDETNGGTAVGVDLGGGPVENLQITYVMDSTGVGNPAAYTTTSSINVSTPSIPASIRSVRVAVEGITTLADGMTNKPEQQRQIYSSPTFEGVGPTTGGLPSTTTDAYPRRQFTMNVVPRSLQVLNGAL